jgi:hypothetical protein
VNIKKGDWVQYKKEPSMQGRVTSLRFYRTFNAQDALMRHSRKWCTWADVHDLRVIRRGGRNA